jgi:ornithine carbamoyltransferase
MRIPKIKSKDLLTVTDFSPEEIINVFNFAIKLKKIHKSGKRQKILRDKTLAMIFDKSSTRTRVSFEAGIAQLGGQGLFLEGDTLQLGRGESPSDTAKVLSRYVDGIMIRTFSHKVIEDLAKFSDVPVINGLTDSYHPCQALTDYFTIYETHKNLKKVKLAYIGDGSNNMAHSLLLCGALLGSDITISTPKKFLPDLEIQEKAYKIASLTDSNISITTDIEEAAHKANYLYTDVWTSMGQEREANKRKKALGSYKITKKLLDKSAPQCKVMHCLPAHRGEEIDADVIDSDDSIVFDQAENRLHLQKAVMCALMANNKKRGTL